MTKIGVVTTTIYLHLQVLIRIECAFGIMVQHWGILQMGMPKGLSIVRIMLSINEDGYVH